MKVARSPEFFLACCNHPRVRPYIGGDGISEVELEPARWERSVILEWPEGCIAFERIAPGVYAGHWVFLPDAPDVVERGRKALRHLFTRCGANRVIGKTPAHLRHARKAARAVGMRHLFTCDGYSHSAMTRQEFSKEG